MLKGIGKGIKLLPGSPLTMFVPWEDGFIVIDPGSSEDRTADIRAQGKVKAVLLTHFHSDHVLAAKGLESELGTHAPIVEACGVESVGLRRAVTFGGYAPEGLIYHVKAVSVQVDHVFRHPFQLGPVETVPLPGHTYGQVGYVANRILYAADSFFGDKLLKSAVIPYYQDYGTALETLRWLREHARDFRKLVPSHGPVVEGKRAEELLDFNIGVMEELPDKVMTELASKPMTVEELTSKLLREGGGKVTVSSIILSAVTIRSLLARLYEESKVSAETGERGILWKLNM